MKKCRWLFIMLSLFSVVSQFLCPVFAIEYEDLITKTALNSEPEKFLAKIKLNVITTEIEPYPIESFAISNNGNIALGVNSSNDALIYVYSSDGNFLYGYQFISSVFDVFFDAENVAIYWGKENYAATFDVEGNCIKFFKTDGYKENSNQKYDGYAKPTSGIVGSVQYKVEYGIGLSPQYVKLTIKDSLGNSREIYNVETEHNTKIIGCTTILLIAFSIWSICYFYHVKQSKTTNQ